MRKHLIVILFLFLLCPSSVAALGKSFTSSDANIKRTVIMKVNEQKSLDDLFNGVSSHLLWEVKDSSILKIENGMVIGLNFGVSEVIARSDRDIYYLHVTVINNPETLSTIYITVVVILLISFGTGCILTIKDYKDKKNKEELDEDIEIL